MRTFLLLAPLALAGCSLSEDTFGDRVAVTWCATVKACNERAFWGTYEEGTPECRATVAAEVDRTRYGDTDGVVPTSCSWAPEGASTCLQRLESASCNQVDDPYWLGDCTRRAWDCIAVYPGAER